MQASNGVAFTPKVRNVELEKVSVLRDLQELYPFLTMKQGADMVRQLNTVYKLPKMREEVLKSLKEYLNLSGEALMTLLNDLRL